MSAVMSLRGLMTFYEGLLSENLFINLPVNLVTDVGAENLNSIFLLKCAEQEVTIPNPTEMGKAIKAWSSINKKVFATLYDMEIQFSKTQGEKTEKITRDVSGSVQTCNEETLSQNSNSGTSGSDSTLNKIAGFNSTSLVDRSSDTITYGGKATYTETNNNNKNSDETETRKETENREVSASALDSLQFKYRHIANMNCVDMIVGMFKDEFILGVY